jgi:cytochrome c-type biogenesis protein CcmH
MIRWMKTVQVIALAAGICFTMGESEAGARFENLGHRLMCACGCAQLLGECNHVGCPSSTNERKELVAAIAADKNDRDILALFSAKYGGSIKAAPDTVGFELVAWIAPFAVFAAGIIGTILLVRRWTTDPQDGEAVGELIEGGHGQ